MQRQTSAPEMRLVSGSRTDHLWDVRNSDSERHEIGEHPRVSWSLSGSCPLPCPVAEGGAQLPDSVRVCLAKDGRLSGGRERGSDTRGSCGWWWAVWGAHQSPRPAFLVSLGLRPRSQGNVPPRKEKRHSLNDKSHPACNLISEGRRGVVGFL